MSSPLSVLIVDDNADALRSLAILVRAGNYDVRTAGSGAEALAQLGDWCPDVALLDLAMPAMDGCVLAERIRAQVGPGAFLAAVTGYGDDLTIRRAELAGFDRIFLKGDDPELILDMLGSHAARIAGR